MSAISSTSDCRVEKEKNAAARSRKSAVGASCRNKNKALGLNQRLVFYYKSSSYSVICLRICLLTNKDIPAMPTPYSKAKIIGVNLQISAIITQKTAYNAIITLAVILNFFCFFSVISWLEFLPCEINRYLWRQ